MAKARINKWGDSAILKLTFREAAALRALLARVGDETDPDINDDTYATFVALDALMGEVQGRAVGLWPLDYEAFAAGVGALIEPPEREPPPAMDNVIDIEDYRKAGECGGCGGCRRVHVLDICPPGARA